MSIRRISSSLINSAMLLAGSLPALADEFYSYSFTSEGYSTSTYEIFKGTFSSSGVNLEKITTFTRTDGIEFGEDFYNRSENKLYFWVNDDDNFRTYDIDSDTWGTATATIKLMIPLQILI